MGQLYESRLRVNIAKILLLAFWLMSITMDRRAGLYFQTTFIRTLVLQTSLGQNLSINA